MMAPVVVVCMLVAALSALGTSSGWHVEGKGAGGVGGVRPSLKRQEVLHECAHDKFMVPRITAILKMRDASIKARLAVEKADAGNSRRLLQTPTTPPAEAPIRIQPIYQLPATLSPDNANFIKNVIVPNATQFLQRAIRVRQPVSGPLKLTLTCRQYQYFTRDGQTIYQCSQYVNLTCMDAQVDPSHLADRQLCSDGSCETIAGGEGVPNADLVLYVTSTSTQACVGNTVAHAGACMFDTNTDRPVAGNVNFCPKFYDSSIANVQGRLTIAIHELTHALVFSPSLWPYFRDNDGNPLVTRTDGAERLFPDQPDLSSIIGTFQERGRTVTKIITPQVVARAQEHFGCPTLNGAELEDGGGPGTAGAHWEARILSGEIMEGVSHSNDQVYTAITLGLLEDSGWYRVNYEVGGKLLFGLNRGCDFAVGDCASPATASAFKEYSCSASNTVKKCTPDNLAVGYCVECTAGEIQSSTCLTDGCSRIFGYSNYFCTDPQSDAATAVGQYSGPGGRCIQQGPEPWSVGGTQIASTGAGCFLTQCDMDATGKYKLSVQINNPSGGDGVWVDCVDNKMVALPRPTFSSGTLGPCPVAADFCNQVNCPNDCTSQGTCYNGTCHCFPGFAGSMCEKAQCLPGQCPTGQICDNVLGICKNPGPPSPPPPPRPPAPPTRRPPPRSGSQGTPSSVVDSAISFGGLSLDSNSFNTNEFETHFKNAMLAAGQVAARSTGFQGDLHVSISNIRRGSVISESLVQFSPAAGIPYSDAAEAGTKLQSKISTDPASIFSSDAYFTSAGPITAVRSSMYQGSSAPGTGNAYINRASSAVRRLFKKTWFIVTLTIVLALAALAWVYWCVKWCCGRKSVRY